MIRILIPRHTYNEHRIKLVERLTTLQICSFSNVKRAFVYLEQNNDSFFEGFLENEIQLKLVAERLSDNYHLVKQEKSWDEIDTWVIEDADDLQDVPY